MKKVAAIGFLLLGFASRALANNPNSLADNVLAVHGWTDHDPTQAEADKYWNRNQTVSTAFADQTKQLCGDGRGSTAPCQGNNTSGQTVDIRYNSASTTWDDVTDNGPTCKIADALDISPGTNMAVMAHSNGGLGAVMLVAAAQQGLTSKYSCTGTPSGAVNWLQRIMTMGSPFLGAQVANAVTGGSSSCTTEAGLLSWIWPALNNSGVKHLTTTYMTSASGWTVLKNCSSYTVVTAYGYQAACGTNGSTNTDPTKNCGNSSSVMCTLQSLCNAGVNNDGVVNQDSATGNSSRPNNFSIGWNGAYNHLSMADGSCTTNVNYYSATKDYGNGMFSYNYY